MLRPNAFYFSQNSFSASSEAAKRLKQAREMDFLNGLEHRDILLHYGWFDKSAFINLISLCSGFCPIIINIIEPDEFYINRGLWLNGESGWTWCDHGNILFIIWVKIPEIKIPQTDLISNCIFRDFRQVYWQIQCPISHTKLYDNSKYT